MDPLESVIMTPGIAGAMRGPDVISFYTDRLKEEVTARIRSRYFPRVSRWDRNSTPFPATLPSVEQYIGTAPTYEELCGVLHFVEHLVAALREMANQVVPFPDMAGMHRTRSELLQHARELSIAIDGRAWR